MDKKLSLGERAEKEGNAYKNAKPNRIAGIKNITKDAPKKPVK